jgi:endonuclease I
MGVLNGVGALAFKGLAIAYGLFTIFLAVLYSLTRKDTWVTDKDDELLFKKGSSLNFQVESSWPWADPPSHWYSLQNSMVIVRSGDRNRFIT